ncbi:MAG: hypothetical protein A2007_00315 [Verrucomicrobia bacterium GWC2_42_7]|nr:MAG: hypothetical protein A2007_00315 [Verrucomicrobia bacterium GWC2_42_7]
MELESTTKKPLVLLVDDDKFVLHFLQLSLKHSDFEVVTASSVDEGQKVLESKGIENFFCVLTDYLMPGKKGVELLKWIQKKDRTLSTIIVTGEGEKEIVQGFLRDGATDFLEKPSSKTQIMTAVLKGIETTLKSRNLMAKEDASIELPIPILNEKYTGSQITDIDQIQKSWESTLGARLPKSIGDRFQDLIVCLREGVLNAMEYGCLKSPDKLCSLKISFYEKTHRIVVKIEDPGQGHNFQISTALDIDGTEERDLHLGLAIMNNLSDAFSLERNGATVFFEFHLLRASSLS